MELKIFNYGAYVQGEIHDNEFHSHDCIQLSRAKSDSVISFVNEDVSLKCGEFILIAHSVQHKINDNDWINILVDNECIVGEKLTSLLDENSFKILKTNEVVQRVFDNPGDELSKIDEGVREEVKRAIFLIAEHDHNCELKEIAKQVALSPDRFRKVFKEEVGITFTNYLRWQKIKRAFTLLSNNPDLKLVDIAHSSGFSDQAHMSKIIKETFGYNPKNIKNNL